MLKGKTIFIAMLVMVTALLLAACGGNSTPAATQASGDSSNNNTQTTDSDNDTDGSVASVTFGVTGQMFVVNDVPEGWNVSNNIFGNGKIAVSAVSAPLSGVSMQDFVNAAATALGTAESTTSNGRTVYTVSSAAGFILWVSPDDTNIITITATQITDDPANYKEELLVVAGSIEQQ